MNARDLTQRALLDVPMQEPGSGPYDRLYAARPDRPLWSPEPGRLVRRILEFRQAGRVLDAGCGDGKNALYLERLGFSVDGFDCSTRALSGLHARFKAAGMVARGEYHVADVLDYAIAAADYDVVVSYGLYHCLEPQDRVSVHQRVQGRVRPGGVIFFTCLTDVLPLPEGHGTPGITLAAASEVDTLFTGWRILVSFAGVIFEDHLPVVGKHEHTAMWVIAERPRSI